MCSGLVIFICLGFGHITATNKTASISCAVGALIGLAIFIASAISALSH